MKNKYILSNEVEFGFDELEREKETIIVKKAMLLDTPYLTSNSGYFVIDNDTIEMLTAMGIDTGAKLIYLCLVRQSHNNKVCFISIRRLSEISGISERSVIKHIKNLKDKKLIKVSYKGGIRNRRHLANEYKIRYVYCKKEELEVFSD